MVGIHCSCLHFLQRCHSHFPWSDRICKEILHCRHTQSAPTYYFSARKKCQCLGSQFCIYYYQMSTVLSPSFLRTYCFFFKKKCTLYDLFEFHCACLYHTICTQDSFVPYVTKMGMQEGLVFSLHSIYLREIEVCQNYISEILPHSSQSLPSSRAKTVEKQWHSPNIFFGIYYLWNVRLFCSLI